MVFPSPRPVRRRVLVLALAGALGSGVVFAETATVRKATELRSTPAASADVVGELKAQESVDITARQGAWANVTTPSGLAGWARVLNFRSVAAANASRSGADLGALFATGSTGATSTNSAKGFGSNDLMGASPDMAALSQLDGYAANPGDARSFAGEAPVQPQQVAYLPEGRKSR